MCVQFQSRISELLEQLKQTVVDHSITADFSSKLTSLNRARQKQNHNRPLFRLDCIPSVWAARWCPWPQRTRIGCFLCQWHRWNESKWFFRSLDSGRQTSSGWIPVRLEHLSGVLREKNRSILVSLDVLKLIRAFTWNNLEPEVWTIIQTIIQKYVVRTARYIVGGELPSPPGHLHQAVYKESPEDHQWFQPPVPQTSLSAALRKSSPQHLIPH